MVQSLSLKRLLASKITPKKLQKMLLILSHNAYQTTIRLAA